MKIMDFRFFLVGIGLATMMCIASFLIILFSFDPFEAGPIIILLFYLSLFLSLVGIFGLTGFFLRTRWARHKKISADTFLSFGFLRNSLRQGGLLAFLLVGSLWLKNTGWLSWITGIVLLVIVIGIEGYFLRKKS